MAVGRNQNVHARESPQHCNVVQTVVGGAEGSVGETSADAEDFDGIAAVGNVNLDLLKGTGYIKAGRAAANDLLAAVGQSCGNADSILLGNAAFYKLFR